MRDPFRPFEILKLVRDGVVTNIKDFGRVRMSRFVHDVRRLLQGCETLGLVEIGADGNVRATNRLASLLESLDLSLAQLEALDAGSVVCNPAFGRVSQQPAADVFVLMPFYSALKPVYDDHIRGVAGRLNLTAARADDFFTANSMMSDIWTALNVCRVAIADCTGRNPNVFYELGIAHTLGKPVVLIAQASNDIPFDVHYIRTIIYDLTPRGMREFEESLSKTLRSVLARPANLAEWLQKGYPDHEDDG